jgi:hypothetical protein
MAIRTPTRLREPNPASSAAGLIDASPGDTGHRGYGSPLAQVQAVHPDERLRGLAASSVSLSRLISTETSAWQACKSLM